MKSINDRAFYTTYIDNNMEMIDRPKKTQSYLKTALMLFKHEKLRLQFIDRIREIVFILTGDAVEIYNIQINMIRQIMFVDVQSSVLKHSLGYDTIPIPFSILDIEDEDLLLMNYLPDDFYETDEADDYYEEHNEYA